MKYFIKGSKFLVTGGAGFIGSNLVDYLLSHGAGHVRVLDNLSNGLLDNLKEHFSKTSFEFIEGDIRDLDTCRRAVNGMEFISHQAALGSVPRSINDPITTNDVNISGFLTMMVAAKEEPSVKKMVYAASSSTYGDSKALPKEEGKEGKPLSPYAVTKAVNEYYGEVFSSIYGFHTIGLRYFNVFGPKQNPDNPYAAVIPIFCKKVLNKESPVINGDGETSRDFTYVDNAVLANILALSNGMTSVTHRVYNVACGERISLNNLISSLSEISGYEVKPDYFPERSGDVKHSHASIEKIKKELGYYPVVKFKDGIEQAYAWYKSKLDNN